MISHEKLHVMLALQDEMNSKINYHWFDAQYPYLRAAVVEGAEAMEHHGWKWWRAQQKDLPQLQMELVDIWHFILSQTLLESDRLPEKAIQLMTSNRASEPDALVFDRKEYRFAEMDTLAKLELVIGLSVVRRICINLFEALLRDCAMTWDDLFEQYVAKNVLNMFRQDHGYKEGTYLKVWAGREDNEHLVEIMGTIDLNSTTAHKALYQSLSQRYQALSSQ